MGDSKPSDDDAYLEQRIFIVSPFGTWTTALILYVLGVASYIGVAALSGVALLPMEHFLFDPQTRLASVLLLILCVSIAMQRFTRLKEQADFDAFAMVLRGGAADAAVMTSLMPRGARLWPSTLAGLGAGLALGIVFFARNPGTDLATHPALFCWFITATTLLALAFARGVALTRATTKAEREIVENRLLVDLLHIERLYVWGRAAARVALIWFSVSAAACLLFVSGEITVLTVLILGGCAAMGLWVFVATMELIRRKIRAAKAEELEKLRGEIAELRVQVHQDAHAAAKLHGLLAYETRIAAVHEWPFDQTTLMRVGASALILTVPWFGQAITQYFVEQFARTPG